MTTFIDVKLFLCSSLPDFVVAKTLYRYLYRVNSSIYLETIGLVELIHSILLLEINSAVYLRLLNQIFHISVKAAIIVVATIQLNLLSSVIKKNLNQLI